MPDPVDPRDRVLGAAFETTVKWAWDHEVAAAPRLYRLCLAAVTESYGGRNLANDGSAFPDTGTTPWADETVSVETRRATREVLRRSLDLPHDKDPRGKDGDNGGSTGFLQQLSKDYVRTRLAAAWGWGSLEDTMHVPTATRMFLDACPVTDLLVYNAGGGKTVTLTDPIARDVLTCQRPAYSEAMTTNYGPVNIATAKRVVNNWHPRYFTNGGT